MEFLMRLPCQSLSFHSLSVESVYAPCSDNIKSLQGAYAMLAGIELCIMGEISCWNFVKI